MIAIGPFFSRRPEVFLVLGLVVGLVYWITGEAFGQLLTFSGTDPSNGPPLLLLGLGLLPTVPAARTAPSLARSLFDRHPVRASLGLVAAATAVAAIPLSTSIASASTPAPPLTMPAQEAGMASGQPLVEPVNLNRATPPTLRVRLVAEWKRFDIGGKLVWGESYDGDYIGPTMHFVPDEHVILTLVNKLPTATNVVRRRDGT